MKRLILVTSPPACGKTYVSKKLSKALKNIVYLDKDTLIPLSIQVFKAANEEVDRSSAFFEEWVRNPEYRVIEDLAYEALEYADLVLINAPFTREIRNPEWMNATMDKLAAIGAKLTVIWVNTSPDVSRQRMIERASDRDHWKLSHWDEYVKGRDYSVPKILQDPDCNGELIVFNNNSYEEFTESIERISNYLLEK